MKEKAVIKSQSSSCMRDENWHLSRWFFWLTKNMGDMACCMAYHCQSDCQTSWFKDMSSVLIILCLFFYLAIIWQSQVKVYFSLDLILLLSDPIPYVARSKLTLHSAQLFRRGWCWYYSILEALRSKKEGWGCDAIFNGLSVTQINRSS